MNRVVITGAGTVNALGLTVPDTLEAMREGRCGIGPLSFRDVERLSIQMTTRLILGGLISPALRARRPFRISRSLPARKFTKGRSPVIRWKQWRLKKRAARRVPRGNRPHQPRRRRKRRTPWC